MTHAPQGLSVEANSCVSGFASRTVKIGLYREMLLWSQYVIVPGASISIKPRILSHTEAAALPLVGVSALQGLTEYLKLSADKKS